MTREKSPVAKASSSGFTLMETAIVIVIAAMLLIAGIAMVKTWMAQATLTANQQRLAAIQTALSNYVTQNNRLPCPASYTAQPTDTGPYFGREVVYTTTYTGTGCGSATGAAPYYYTTGSGTFAETNAGRVDGTYVTDENILIGAVPARDLGLPDSLMMDTYGHYFTYAVTQAATTVETTPTAPMNTLGVIEVVDGSLNDVTPKVSAASGQTGTGTAVYVLVDHGKDGKGAYTGAATGPGIACLSAPGLDQGNCSFETGAGPFVHFVNTPFSNAKGKDWFDDMVVYGTSFSPSTGAQVCMTANNIVLSKSGTSGGHYANGIDTGPVGGVGFIFVYVWYFYDNFDISDDYVATYTSTSPTADAFCPDATYHVVTGGCTQTNGDASFTSGTVINAFGGDIVIGDSVPSIGGGTVAIPPKDQLSFSFLGHTYSTPAQVKTLGLADLINAKLYQTVTPPLSHPALPGSLGTQGWECNGSSAIGMKVQAYVTCCPN